MDHGSTWEGKRIEMELKLVPLNEGPAEGAVPTNYITSRYRTHGPFNPLIATTEFIVNRYVCVASSK